MNAKDKQDLELVHYRLDELDKKMDELKADMSKAHGKTDSTLSFIKENLFNPNEGLWVVLCLLWQPLVILLWPLMASATLYLGAPQRWGN